MRRVRYQVAMSLDGFIAGPNGEYDWIDVDPVAARPYFKKLYAQFDTAVMGRRTFELVRGPVQGMRTYVFSRTLPRDAHRDVTVLGDDGVAALAELRAQDGKDIWLFGGGVLFGSLAAAGLVDTVEVGVIPIILGGGIPLAVVANRVKLKLLDTDTTSLPGMVGLSYSVEHAR